MTGIVLAGGGSVRFGSDKLITEVDGRPLVQHPILALAKVCDEVVVVAAHGPVPPVPVPDPADVGVPVWVAHDPVPDGGPLVGLAAGLAVASGSVAIVAGGDMPSLSPQVLRLMLATIAERDAVALEDDQGVRPLPCVVKTVAAMAAAGPLLAGRGLGLRELLSGLEVIAIPPKDWRGVDSAGATLRDIDEPGDLEDGGSG